MVEANRLDELVHYQEGSVVSRTIIDKKTGTVTLFAFDEDEGLSEHTTPYDGLVYVYDGKAEITISGAPTRSVRATLSLCPPTSPTHSEPSPRSR